MEEHNTARYIRALCGLAITASAALVLLLTLVLPARECGADRPWRCFLEWRRLRTRWGVMCGLRPRTC